MYVGLLGLPEGPLWGRRRRPLRAAGGCPFGPPEAAPKQRNKHIFDNEVKSSFPSFLESNHILQQRINASTST